MDIIIVEDKFSIKILYSVSVATIRRMEENSNLLAVKYFYLQFLFLPGKIYFP